MPLGTEKGQLLIISGPSGSGKGTVTKKLIPCDNFALSVSMTTRDPRPGEVHGVDYIFCTKENFMEIRDNDGFLEHATFSGNYYGTPISYVESKIDEGQTVVLEIEVVGALQVKQKYPDAILVFLMPPTFADLRQRLIERGTECEDEIERRTRRAREEMVELEKYDYLVVNDDIEQAMQDIHMVVKAEKMKPHRNQCKIETFYGDNMEGEENEYR